MRGAFYSRLLFKCPKPPFKEVKENAEEIERCVALAIWIKQLYYMRKCVKGSEFSSAGLADRKIPIWQYMIVSNSSLCVVRCSCMMKSIIFHEFYFNSHLRYFFLIWIFVALHRIGINWSCLVILGPIICDLPYQNQKKKKESG